MSLADDLKAIEEREQAATPGPWLNEYDTGRKYYGTRLVIPGGNTPPCFWESGPMTHKPSPRETDLEMSDNHCEDMTDYANAEFSAHARTDVMVLTRMVRILAERYQMLDEAKDSELEMMWAKAATPHAPTESSK